MADNGAYVKVDDVLASIKRATDHLEKYATGYTADYSQGFEEGLLGLADCLTGFCHSDLQIPTVAWPIEHTGPDPTPVRPLDWDEI